MKRIAGLTLMIAAAALSAGALNAEVARMNANIPFGFEIPGGKLDAGSYIVRFETRRDGSSYLQFDGRETRKGAFVMLSTAAGKNGKGTSRLVFRCSEDGSECALAQVWGPGETGYNVPTAKRTSGSKERAALISLDLSKSSD